MKDSLKNLLVLLVTVGICFFVLEMGLRVFAPQIIECAVNYQWRMDDEVLPYVPKPNYKGRMVLKDQFDVSLRTNSSGFRNDKDFSAEKDPDVKRIAFLGDSFTFGWGVEGEETYAYVLQSLLNSGSAGKKVEVMNAAVYGYDIIECREMFYRILEFRPDFIFLGFCLENDFNITPLKTQGESGEVQEILIEKKDLASSVRELVNNLHTVAMIRDRLYITFPKIRNIMLSLGVNNKRDIFLEEYTDELNMSLEKTGKILEEMNRVAHENGAGFAVVLIPLKEQVYCRDEINKFPGFDVDRPNQVMGEILDRNGIDHIDLLPGLLDEKERTSYRLYFDIDPHWTRHGHKAVADIIFGSYKGKIGEKDDRG